MTGGEEVVLFGGYTGSGNSGLSNATWTFDGSDWTQRTPKHGPSARYLASMAYDAVSQEVVLFGGFSGSSYTNELDLRPPRPTRRSPSTRRRGSPTATLTATPAPARTRPAGHINSEAAERSAPSPRAKVHIVAAGECKVTAYQGGNADYNAAPRSPARFQIARSRQTISFTRRSASPRRP